MYSKRPPVSVEMDMRRHTMRITTEDFVIHILVWHELEHMRKDVARQLVTREINVYGGTVASVSSITGKDYTNQTKYGVQHTVAIMCGNHNEFARAHTVLHHINTIFSDYGDTLLMPGTQSRIISGIAVIMADYARINLNPFIAVDIEENFFECYYDERQTFTKGSGC